MPLGLAALALERGVTPPVTPGPMQEKTLGELPEISASTFDRRYLESQQGAHEAAIALFASYAEGGDDPVLRAYAAEVLPTLRAHLADVETLQARTP